MSTKRNLVTLVLLCAVLMGGASSRAWAVIVGTPPPVFYDFNGMFDSELVTGRLELAQDDVVQGEKVSINPLTSFFFMGITNGVFSPLYAGITNGVFSPFVTFGVDNGGLPPIVGAEFDNGVETFNFVVSSPGAWSVVDSTGIIASGAGEFSPSAPEPTTILLLGLGLAGLGFTRRRLSSSAL